MADIYTLANPTITINMDDFKITFTWQIPPSTDPTITESVTHTITFELGKGVVQDLRPVDPGKPKSDKTSEG